MTEPPLESVSAHLGHRGAWMAAVAALGVLGVFIYIGAAGRDAARPAVAQATALATGSATAPVTSTPPAPAGPVRGPGRAPAAVEQVRPNPGEARPYQFLGVVLRLGGEGYIADTAQVEHGRYVATYRIRTPFAAQRGTVEVAQVAATTSHDSWASMGRWGFELDPQLGLLPTAGNLFEYEVGPLRATAMPGDPPLAATGYRIAIRTSSQPGHALLNIEILAGPGEGRAHHPRPSLVDRDWPLRKDKHDLVTLYRSFVDL